MKRKRIFRGFLVVVALSVMAFFLYKLDKEKADINQKHLTTLAEKNNTIRKLDSLNFNFENKSREVDSINNILKEKEKTIEKLNVIIKNLQNTTSYLTSLPKKEEVKKIKFENN